MKEKTKIAKGIFTSISLLCFQSHAEWGANGNVPRTDDFIQSTVVACATDLLVKFGREDKQLKGIGIRSLAVTSMEIEKDYGFNNNPYILFRYTAKDHENYSFSGKMLLTFRKTEPEYDLRTGNAKKYIPSTSCYLTNARFDCNKDFLAIEAAKTPLFSMFNRRGQPIYNLNFTCSGC